MTEELRNRIEKLNRACICSGAELPEAIQKFQALTPAQKGAGLMWQIERFVLFHVIDLGDDQFAIIATQNNDNEAENVFQTAFSDFDSVGVPGLPDCPSEAEFYKSMEESNAEFRKEHPIHGGLLPSRRNHGHPRR